MPPGRATTACIKADLKQIHQFTDIYGLSTRMDRGEGSVYTELAKGIPTARSYCDSADAG